MLIAHTEKQKQLIVSNIVRACQDIEKLNGTGYKFIYLASGFIAHTSINGFIGHYSTHNLKLRILSNVKQNMWDNFKQGDQNYDYYMSKADIYRRIVRQLVG